MTNLSGAGAVVARFQPFQDVSRPSGRAGGAERLPSSASNANFTRNSPAPQGNAQGKTAQGNTQGNDARGANAQSNAKAPYECLTCENRRYQDGSNDPGVSFKTPTKIDPASAASAVLSHEREHVSHETAKAKTEGREILFQSVTLHMGICGECGKSYVAGGTTRTVSRGKDRAQLFRVGLPGEQGGKPLALRA